MTRGDGRRPTNFGRSILQPDFLEQPHGCVLYAQGNTVVLRTATLEEGPAALAAGQGPRLADSGVLDAARIDGERTQRAVSRGRPDGRTVEIQRLIGRSLRGLRLRGARRALGSTATSCRPTAGLAVAITGSYVAAYRALDRFGLSKALPGGRRGRLGRGGGRAARCSTSTTRRTHGRRPT